MIHAWECSHEVETQFRPHKYNGPKGPRRWWRSESLLMMVWYRNMSYTYWCSAWPIPIDIGTCPLLQCNCWQEGWQVSRFDVDCTDKCRGDWDKVFILQNSLESCEALYFTHAGNDPAEMIRYQHWSFQVHQRLWSLCVGLGRTDPIDNSASRLRRERKECWLGKPDLCVQHRSKWWWTTDKQGELLVSQCWSVFIWPCIALQLALFRCSGSLFVHLL